MYLSFGPIKDAHEETTPTLTAASSIQSFQQSGDTGTVWLELRRSVSASGVLVLEL